MGFGAQRLVIVPLCSTAVFLFMIRGRKECSATHLSNAAAELGRGGFTGWSTPSIFLTCFLAVTWFSLQTHGARNDTEHHTLLISDA